MPGSRLRLFLVLLFFSVFVMTLQNRYGVFRPFKFLIYPLSFVNETFVSASDYVGNTLRKYTIRDEEIRKLEREVRDLRLSELRARELLLENRRLKEALEMKELTSNYVAAARVISRGGGRWANAYVIDKGTDASVEKDMTVITEDGLLGKIQEAYGSYSVVLLINDARFSAGARLEYSRVEAVLSGAGPNLCRVKYVDASVEVAPGEVVVTSGLDGLFPPGIPSAYVTKVQTVEGALFHRIEAMPLVNTSKVEEVIIIK